MAQFDVAYYAASTDSPETSRSFAESLGVTYPMLSDPGKEVARAYGVVGPLLPWASRWTFYIGTDGRVLFIDRDVRTRSAGPDMVARLRELGVGPKRPTRR